MTRSNEKQAAGGAADGLSGWLMRQLGLEGVELPDLSKPAGEEALVGPDSVSWQVFANPVSLFIGGVTAVILELAEPRVRSGVWDFTTFRTDPLRRMQRTGIAAMITVYGARSLAERRIAQVRRMHDAVAGQTPAGVAYRANDPHLLNWVQATAAFGFVEAYSSFVRPLSREDKDRFYAEGDAAARLYGADDPPGSVAGWEARLAAMLPELEPSPILDEFFTILHRTRIFPWPLRAIQDDMIEAAASLVPAPVRTRLRLGERGRLADWRQARLRMMGRALEFVELPVSARAQARARLAQSSAKPSGSARP